ncbi:DUF6153 family protein [Streptomyces sp. LP11]|uniref:DUF6153 family protein n=1 Tax=Streptomyces pyxinicus TaxID=2970331 RepID=A0ABT2AYJ8_9ACTN|nr:DUF6153 family protein [Streptomyces sp. LP11]MCS0600783.1 DUF6153 family protein [Streptomyces sp. LP11]
MRSTGQHPQRPPGGRYRALSVLVLLVGLLGMHGLAPGGAAEHTTHVRNAHATVAFDAMDDCPGGDGHCGGNRMHHADPTCASGAVNGGPELPALTPDRVTAPPSAGTLCPRTAATPDGARAPPSLAELQLLRI